MIPLSISLRANPGTGIVVSEEGFPLKMRKSAWPFCGSGSPVQRHCSKQSPMNPKSALECRPACWQFTEKDSQINTWEDVESRTEQRGKWACHQHNEDLSQSYDVPRTQCPAKLFQIMAFSLPSDSSNEACPRQLWGDLSSPLREFSLEPGSGLLAYGLGQGVSPPQGLVSPSFMKEKVADILGWGQGFTKTAGAKHCHRGASGTQYRHILGKTVTQRGMLWGQMGQFFFILRWGWVFDMDEALEEAVWKGEGFADGGLERTLGSPINFSFPEQSLKPMIQFFRNCLLRREQNHSPWASQLG